MNYLEKIHKIFLNFNNRELENDAKHELVIVKIYCTPFGIFTHFWLLMTDEFNIILFSPDFMFLKLQGLWHPFNFRVALVKNITGNNYLNTILFILNVTSNTVFLISPYLITYKYQSKVYYRPKDVDTIDKYIYLYLLFTRSSSKNKSIIRLRIIFRSHKIFCAILNFEWVDICVIFAKQMYVCYSHKWTVYIPTIN